MAESPEAVALELFRSIADAEEKSLGPSLPGKHPDRAWILQTYAECLKCVRGPQTYSERKAAQDR
jgi:hypothetical protein